jgi:hypothetical protein
MYFHEEIVKIPAVLNPRKSCENAVKPGRASRSDSYDEVASVDVDSPVFVGVAVGTGVELTVAVGSGVDVDSVASVVDVGVSVGVVVAASFETTIIT